MLYDTTHLGTPTKVEIEYVYLVLNLRTSPASVRRAAQVKIIRLNKLSNINFSLHSYLTVIYIFFFIRQYGLTL